MEQLTIEEKRAYIDRIDQKAKAEGISNKHAARKLGLHEWKYYQYKNDLKKYTLPPQVEKPGEDPVKITIMLTKQAYDYISNEAKDFALAPEVVAQMMLHHAVMKSSRKKNGEEVTP